MESLHLTEDAWLGERLGKPAFHLSGCLGASNLGWDRIIERLSSGPVFVDAKIPVDDLAAGMALQAAGFFLIDTNLRFVLPRTMVPVASTSVSVSFARPDMAGEVAALASNVFVYDRFHRDLKIDHATASAIKGEWAWNFFTGKRGEWMVVACVDGRVAGFLQLLRSQADELVVDLIAVDVAYQGQGLASAMIAFAADQCDPAGPVVVGTQVANLPSVRFYEKLGFRLAGAQYVYHFHGVE